MPKIADASDRITITALSPQAQEISAKFRVYDLLTRNLDGVLDLIAANYAGMTMATAAAIHDKIAEGIVSPYEQLSGDKSLRQGVESIWKPIESGPRARADAVLSPEKIDRMLSPENPSLYDIVYYLKRRGALEALENLRASVPGNVVIGNLGTGKPPLAALDLSAGSDRKAQVRIPPALRILANAAHGMQAASDWSYVLTDREILGELRSVDRRTEIYARLTPSLNPKDGVIRINYKELGYGFGPEARLRFVAAVFYLAGFSVDAQNGSLTAVLDESDKNLSRDHLNLAAALALRALLLTDGLDQAFVLLAQDGPSDAEFAGHLDHWAGVLAAKGDLPFYAYGRPEATVQGYRDMLQDGSIQAILLSGTKKVPPSSPKAFPMENLAPIKTDEVIGRAKYYIGKTLVVTFNRDKADKNHLLVAPNASDPDYLSIVDRSAGFIAAGGRLSDPLANKAARLGIFAGFIRGELSSDGLAIKLRVASRWVDGWLKEGDQVRITKAGTLELLPPALPR